MIDDNTVQMLEALRPPEPELLWRLLEMREAWRVHWCEAKRYYLIIFAVLMFTAMACATALEYSEINRLKLLLIK